MTKVLRQARTGTVACLVTMLVLQGCSGIPASRPIPREPETAGVRGIRTSDGSPVTQGFDGSGIGRTPAPSDAGDFPQAAAGTATAPSRNSSPRRDSTDNLRRGTADLLCYALFFICVPIGIVGQVYAVSIQTVKTYRARNP